MKYFPKWTLSWRGISIFRWTVCICRVGIAITNKRNGIKQGRLGSGCASPHIHVDNGQFYLLCHGLLSTEWELLDQNLLQKYRESILIHRLTCDRNILLLSLILSTLVTLMPIIRFALRLCNLNPCLFRANEQNFLSWSANDITFAKLVL